MVNSAGFIVYWLTHWCMTPHYDRIRLFICVCICWKNQPDLRPQMRLSALLAIVNTERKNYMTKLGVTVEDERGRQSG